jgi:hypothetical protein
MSCGTQGDGYIGIGIDIGIDRGLVFATVTPCRSGERIGPVRYPLVLSRHVNGLAMGRVRGSLAQCGSGPFYNKVKRRRRYRGRTGMGPTAQVDCPGEDVAGAPLPQHACLGNSECSIRRAS